MLQGIAYWHSHRFLHVDLKPENLGGRKRLWLRRDPTAHLPRQVVALWYRPPEIMLCACFNKASKSANYCTSSAPSERPTKRRSPARSTT
ncbi:hypothetical protein HPB48_015043 [Haemaphysalis longicornis]|uniref:Protein kinase domain-containing protein n=1 Tax=Haemaphysalis longicornis TaxID=44386 RepID=A0A9J6FM61_HAELO|nr:hypothetical protein HPB48_015043 [Haemaphysalis longicornis]